jgi:dipeptidyl aminopeptidase/acylaminoacyl peptidase
MTRTVRSIVAALFAVAFLTTAPLVLLSTAGYRYDAAKHRVEKTGIIAVDSAPQGARILLNDVAQRKTTPASFTRLLPAEYRVRFERDGYFPWQRAVEVRSSETTFVTDALLLRDSLPRLTRGGAYARAVYTADGRRAALLRDDGAWRELSVLDAGGGAPALLARYGGDTYADADLRWSPDGGKLLFAAHGKDRKPVLFLYDAAAPSAPPRALQGSFPGSRADASWSSDGSRIVVDAAGGAFLVDPANGAVTSAAIGADIQDAALRGNDLFVLRPSKDGVALEKRAPGDLAVAAPFAVLPAGRYRFTDAAGPYLLIAEAKGKLLAVSPDDGRVADTLSADHGVWLAKSRTPRLLAWNDYEITASDVASASHTLVARLGSPIRGCAWHPSGLAAFYATANGIAAVETDDRGRQNVFDLVKFTDVGDFAVDATDGMLRFVGTAGNARGVYEKDY